jgi:hypothetical protein
MLVLMLVTLLGVAVVARGQNSIQGAASASDAAAAEAGAEQGLAEAVARIDSGEGGTFNGRGDLPDGEYRYEVTAVDAQSFSVYAEAEVDGVVRAVDADVGGRALYPYTLFVDDGALFEGNLGSISGRVGSNGPLLITGDAPGDAQDLFGPSANCVACSDPTVLASERDVPVPRPPTAPVQACPSDGIFIGIINGRGGEPIVCDPAAIVASVVTFTDAIVVVDGPVIIHVLDGLDVEVVDATINAARPSSDFQLFLGGDRSSNSLAMSNSRIDGVIYGPGRTSNADRVEIVGSLTIGELFVGRGETLSIRPSDELESYQVSGWQVASWTPVSPR